jgi:hypothetical protein
LRTTLPLFQNTGKKEKRKDGTEGKKGKSEAGGPAGWRLTTAAAQLGENIAVVREGRQKATQSHSRSLSKDNLLSVFWKHIFFLINFAIIFTKKLKIKLHKNCICMHIYVMPTYIYTFRYYIIIYNYTCAMYKIYIVFNFYICINNPLFIYSKEILRFLFSLYIFLLSLYIYIHTHTQSNWQKIHHIILIHISSFDN